MTDDAQWPKRCMHCGVEIIAVTSATIEADLCYRCLRIHTYTMFWLAMNPPRRGALARNQQPEEKQ